MPKRSGRRGKIGSGVRRERGGPRSRELSLDAEDAEFRAAMAALGEGFEAPDKDSSDRSSSDRDSSVGSLPRPRARVRDRQVRREDLDSLDLHGASVEEALERLEAFIVLSMVRDRRQVLVITGRGRRSSSGVPVLRRAVVSWLAREGRGWVRGTEVAPRHLGGDGAVLVRLWRPRPR